MRVTLHGDEGHGTTGFRRPSVPEQMEALRRRIAQLEDYKYAFGGGPALRDEITTCEAELADLRARCEAGGDGAT